MDVSVFRVDRLSIDQELEDIGTVGPDCAHAFAQYQRAPRALVWQNPSSDWKLLMVLVPLPERLSLMRNPIFAQLVRDWGLELRVIGVDREGRLFDFRRLLSQPVLYKLLDALASQESTQALDVVFSMLAQDMLTLFEERRADWPNHLARRHTLPKLPDSEEWKHDWRDPLQVANDSLFDRRSRTQGLIGVWQSALRHQGFSQELYARALRSMDRRESVLELRLAQVLQEALKPEIVQRLQASPVGLHLGCYNWLLIDPRHRQHRIYALSRLTCFAQIFADLFGEGFSQSVARHSSTGTVTGAAPSADAENSALVSRGNSTALQQAVDSGQDRRMIEAIASMFAVQTNTVRHLWASNPSQLGAPGLWRLQQLLLLLDAQAPRDWPRSEPAWEQALERSANLG